MDGFIAQAESRIDLDTDVRGVRVQARLPSSCVDVMGYHDGARDPELLGVREELRAPGPHVRAEPRLEPDLTSLHGVRVVGQAARRTGR